MHGLLLQDAVRRDCVARVNFLMDRSGPRQLVSNYPPELPIYSAIENEELGEPSVALVNRLLVAAVSRPVGVLGHLFHTTA